MKSRAVWNQYSILRKEPRTVGKKSRTMCEESTLERKKSGL